MLHLEKIISFEGKGVKKFEFTLGATHVGLLPTNAKANSTSAGSTHVGLPQTNAKVGFTLAEILITLGIIGIVAAMTMPSLMTSISKRQTEAKLKKAVSMINQAYRLSYNDNGDATAKEAMVLGSEEYFKRYWQPYIKADICTSYQECGYTSNKPWKYRSGKPETSSVIYKNNRVSFYTPDGILYFMITAGGEELQEKAIVYVDLNGGRGPNVIGRDLFHLNRVQDDGGASIIPECNTYTLADVNKDCSRSGEGICCAEKIRRAGWKIDSTYPW